MKYRWHVNNIHDVRIDIEQGRAWVMDYPAENAEFGENKQKVREVEIGSVILNRDILTMRQLVWWKAVKESLKDREITFIDPDAPFRYSIKNLKKVGKRERTKWAAPKVVQSDKEKVAEYVAQIPYMSLDELKMARRRLKEQINPLAPEKLKAVEKAIQEMEYKEGKYMRLRQRRIERGLAKKVSDATDHT